RALGVVFERRAFEPRDDEDETEPVFAMLAETRPADRAAQMHLRAADACFLVNLAAHARDDIFIGFELAAQTVVLAEMMIALAHVAMNHEHALGVGRNYIAEGGEDGRVGHNVAWQGLRAEF